MRYEIQRFCDESFAVSTITYQGEPVWLARDVGIQLGYSRRGERLVSNIREQWSEDFIDGRDVLKVEGDDAQAVFLAFATPDSGVAMTRTALLLTQSGVDLCCILTRKPAGRVLRRWLVDVVFPALRRGEHVGSPATTSAMSGLIARIEDFSNRQMDMFGPTRASLDLALKGQRALQTMRREDRLQRESEAKLERARAQRLRAQERMLKTLGAMNDIPDEVRAALLADLSKGA